MEIQWHDGQRYSGMTDGDTVAWWTEIQWHSVWRYSDMMDGDTVA